MFVANLVSQIQMSKAWKDTLIASTRVPAIFISPFARRGFIDHTNYSVASILKTIEVRYGLTALTDRDLGGTPLSIAAFDFTQATPAAFARTSLGDIPRVPSPPLPARYAGHSMTEMDYDQ